MGSDTGKLEKNPRTLALPANCFARPPACTDSDGALKPQSCRRTSALDRAQKENWSAPVAALQICYAYIEDPAHAMFAMLSLGSQKKTLFLDLVGKRSMPLTSEHMWGGRETPLEGVKKWGCMGKEEAEQRVDRRWIGGQTRREAKGGVGEELGCVITGADGDDAARSSSGVGTVDLSVGNSGAICWQMRGRVSGCVGQLRGIAGDVKGNADISDIVRHKLSANVRGVSESVAQVSDFLGMVSECRGSVAEGCKLVKKCDDVIVPAVGADCRHFWKLPDGCPTQAARAGLGLRRMDLLNVSSELGLSP
ncbi:hypothetical protein B0H14DRAFT_2610607 [Mycena olivaceomarginata]|nr:hypothetical protein B0H14DRAFT_2610607 [Mycena olivaceomarginata]